MLEEQLAQFIADDAWHLHRARALEDNLFALGIDEKAESIQTEGSQSRSLSRWPKPYASRPTRSPR